MFDLGSTSFVLAPEAAKAVKIPVVKRQHQINTRDVSGRDIVMEGLFTIPLGISFGNH
jgi:hypothetical protein